MGNRKRTLVTLKYRSDFSFLRQHGQRVILCSWFLFYCCHNQKGFTRYAWTVPGLLGGAVIRNRLKRWLRVGLREEWRPENLPWDVHFVFRPRGEGFYRKLNYGEFRSLLGKAKKRLQALEFKVS